MLKNSAHISKNSAQLLKNAKVVAKVVAIFVSKQAITSIMPMKSKKSKKSIKSTLLIKSIMSLK